MPLPSPQAGTNGEYCVEWDPFSLDLANNFVDERSDVGSFVTTLTE